ncbi:hypothetical protein [Mycobacterium avium]|uniref:hypothetical protein n=1 Tax=Mycobacterium avium TaxID=1764 RepID=UPI002664F1FA|nr:hypothetical protein [Mycobacterium avium]MDO2354668.1 hypothetical protein [Mycobacterium avium subsp. hominissuis]
MSELNDRRERWRELTETCARIHENIMNIVHAKQAAGRSFTAQEESTLEWFNAEHTRLWAERDALDREMQREMRGEPDDTPKEMGRRLAELRALPYAPVPAEVRQKQVELMRRPIGDPHLALEILERKKLDDDAYTRLLHEAAARRYDARRQESWASSRPGVTWRPQVRDRSLRQRVRTPWIEVTARKARNA